MNNSNASSSSKMYLSTLTASTILVVISFHTSPISGQPNQCNGTTARSCLTQDQINAVTTYNALTMTTNFSSLQAYCSQMVDILSCLTSKNCVADDLKLISDGTPPGYWKGAYDGITYLCTQDGRTGLEKYQSCLTDAQYPAKLSVCSFEFPLTRSCSYYNSLLSCLSTAAQTCSSSTFAVTYAIKSYQPIMSMYLPSCQLSYGVSNHPGLNIIQLVCLLLTTGFVSRRYICK
jgi:hypothetical protein